MMNLKAVLMLPLLAALLLPLTGCWDHKELNNLAIASGIGIAKSDGRYVITVQIENAGEIGKKGAPGAIAPMAVFQSSGVTVFEALKKMTAVSPREIYISHLRFIVLSESLAREGVGEALELFSRSAGFRTDFNILVSRDSDIVNLLSTLTQIEKIPGNSIYSSIRSAAKNWGAFQEISIDEFISKMQSKTTSAVLPGLRLAGDGEVGRGLVNIQNSLAPAQIELNGMAVFKKDKLRGWLNEKESIGFAFAVNEIKNTAVHVPCGNRREMAVNILHAKASIQGQLDAGKPRGSIDLKAEGNIEELACPKDVSKSDVLASLEEATGQKIKQYLTSALMKSQKDLNADVFGFGEAIHRSAPKKWKAIQKQWDELFPRMPVEVSVKVKLRSSGQTNKSYLDNLE
ncbi:Ger(x)C family spore germination protein [Paenibacillus sp. MZ04-78.2]|uniref:Ger(x)C family spore germination protein n=1 Tax=Paenibacillus sp. MZ04-78.2 TaxID=2962034 RepID=UPI0020B7DFE1|nr:Ger(x)C family spore germination protein [Paenibacillus sp. MZ04-78.2]MCP3775620.1 Ger(x)C family spore germination protein [Paenibacillus sp. MZ04-78.2]